MDQKVPGEWNGDLADDCVLERYGMLAHVECMDRGWWWFEISQSKFPYRELYNATNNTREIKLTTGKMARAAAECCMELLRQIEREIEIAQLAETEQQGAGDGY